MSWSWAKDLREQTLLVVLGGSITLIWILVVATEPSDLLTDMTLQLKLVEASSLGLVSFNSPVALSKLAQSSAPGHSQVKSMSEHFVAISA